MKKIIFYFFIINIFCFKAMAYHIPRIAVILPTDKVNTNQVGNALNCMVMSVFEEWKENGYIFEYDTFNDARDADKTARIAQSIGQSNYNYDVVIGTTLSTQALIASSILNQYKIPFIAPLSTHPDVVQGKKYSLRIPFNDVKQATSLAEYSLKLVKNLSSVLIVENESIPYSTFLSAKFKERILSLNPKITISKLTYIAGELSEEKFLSAFQKNHPQIVFAPIYSYDIANTYSFLASDIKENIILLSTDNVGASGQFMRSFGKENSLIKFYFVQHIPKVLTGKYVQIFNKIHANKCNRFNSLMNLGAGFDLANSTLMTLFSKNYNNSPDSFITEFKKIGYNGILGPLNFDDNNEPIKPLYIYTIENMKVVYKDRIL